MIPNLTALKDREMYMRVVLLYLQVHRLITRDKVR